MTSGLPPSLLHGPEGGQKGAALRTLVLIAVVAAIPLFSCTSATETRRDREISMTIDGLMSDYGGPVPGASVLVLKDEHAVFTGSYGLADLENGTPVTPATNFRLASVTKQFTAAAIEILAERGELSYDDPVAKFLGPVPPYAKDVTVGHLLTHSGGLPDYEDLIPESAERQVHDDDVLRLIASTDHSMFAPGEGYHYSNTGYALLALIIERVSGRSFAAFLRETIFTPLHMNDTVAHEEGISSVPHRAYGYVREGDRWIRRDQSVTSAVLGDGGIYSNLNDLQNWNTELDHPRLVSEATMRRATSPVVRTDDPSIGYGFGWRISQHRGHRQVWHSGETSGFRNVLLRFPDDHLTVIVLTNRNGPPPLATALKIADLYLE